MWIGLSGKTGFCLLCTIDNFTALFTFDFFRVQLKFVSVFYYMSEEYGADL